MIILILFNCSYLYTQKNHPYASNIAASSERCARGNFSNAYHSDISVYNFLPAYRCWNLKSKILSSEIKTVKYEERSNINLNHMQPANQQWYSGVNIIYYNSNTFYVYTTSPRSLDFIINNIDCYSSSFFVLFFFIIILLLVQISLLLLFFFVYFF